MKPSNNQLFDMKFAWIFKTCKLQLTWWSWMGARINKWRLQYSTAVFMLCTVEVGPRMFNRLSAASKLECMMSATHKTIKISCSLVHWFQVWHKVWWFSCYILCQVYLCCKQLQNCFMNFSTCHVQKICYEKYSSYYHDTKRRLTPEFDYISKQKRLEYLQGALIASCNHVIQKPSGTVQISLKMISGVIIKHLLWLKWISFSRTN